MTLESFAQGYLFAWMFWGGLSIGLTGLLFLHHSIRARWGLYVLRVLEAGWHTILPMGVLFIPILVAAKMGMLYPWADPSHLSPSQRHFIDNRAAFYSFPLFAARTVFYFVFWYFWGYRLVKSVAKQESTGDLREAQFRADWGTPGIVFHTIIVTFAMTDWLMSLSVSWFSTIYGALFMVTQGLSAIAFATLWVTWHKRKNMEPFASLVDAPLLRDLGNVMLTFTMFWGYFAMSQILIIWSGNLPDEQWFYAFRMNGAWNVIAYLIYSFGFFGTFLLLLYNGTKRTTHMLFGTAALVLVIRVLDMYWNVIPYFNHNTGVLPDVDITPATLFVQSAVCWVVLGAIWFGFFRAAWAKNTPVPTYDPRVPVEGVGAAQEAAGHA